MLISNAKLQVHVHLLDIFIEGLWVGFGIQLTALWVFDAGLFAFSSS